MIVAVALPSFLEFKCYPRIHVISRVTRVYLSICQLASTDPCSCFAPAAGHLNAGELPPDTAILTGLLWRTWTIIYELIDAHCKGALQFAGGNIALVCSDSPWLLVSEAT
jgi:hypothetical protein